ncbi:relaxase/mobilization nuclease domain-containing protein [Bosea sp. PAMC 26642]|uniref:relaxase/mobilization nuclease domain-containing protein n=1 Tax=Bosea sp. (strain PAMC 26642) TaxID=1792307 RepID=UPI0007703350|nr:hypothetical protein [Bosea sp. PAMC 26642]AMJ61598.1 hypothetical protein AXW83_15940 [Bosea sp. PAMC 26642]
MMVFTDVRSIGNLAEHLGKVGRGSNQLVVIRQDELRGVPSDISLALRLMAGVSRASPRVKYDFWHVKISPNHDLTDAELKRVLEVYEAEYGISGAVFRHVVEHRKGRRPPHFHINYSAVDPSTGRALRNTRSKERDELIARKLEVEFGEALVPSIRVERVAQLLREREEIELAEVVARGPKAERGMRHP